MQNNECTYICEQYTEYKENSLSVEVRSKVDSHLAICSPCQAVFQQLNQVLSELHRLNPIKTSASFTDDLMSKIANQNRETVWQRLYQSSYSRVAGYAVAAGLMVAIGLNIWLDPISLGTSGGSENFTGENNSSTPTLAERSDSMATMGGDSLELKPGTINSDASSLQLVSGKKP